jgi:hypothetical protein
MSNINLCLVNIFKFGNFKMSSLIYTTCVVLLALTVCFRGLYSIGKKGGMQLEQQNVAPAG